MKYIRTKDGIYTLIENGLCQTPKDVQNALITGDYKQADTIEELCDKWIIVENGIPHVLAYECDLLDKINNNKRIGITDSVGYGAIWIKLPNGAYRLEPVAKLNDEGKLKLV